MMRTIRSFFKSIITRGIKYAGIPLRDPALVDLFGFRQNQSGVHVDEYTALNFSAYYSGVRLIATTIAMLPFSVYTCDDKTGQVVKDPLHFATKLFATKVNPVTTPFSLMEQLIHYAITWGNGYAWIQRTGYSKELGEGSNTGLPVALWMLPPDQVKPCFDDDGNKIYKFTRKHPGEKDQVYSFNNIIHVKNFGDDGLEGKSCVRIAQESIGLGIATERFGASFFGNNAVPGGVITHPADLGDKGRTNLANEFEEKVKGPLKSRRVVVLDEGMKYTPIGIPPEDSQFLQTRQFQVREIARWLRIPPHMLYDLDAATMNNMSHLTLEFIAYTLLPWIRSISQEFAIKLLNEYELGSKFFDFDSESLVLQTRSERFEDYAKGRNMGLYTLNDLYRKERMKLHDDPRVGDTLIAPSTMKIVGDTDPSTPIDPLTIEQCIALISKPGTTKELAIKILNAAMPSAADDFVKSLAETYARDANK